MVIRSWSVAEEAHGTVQELDSGSLLTIDCLCKNNNLTVTCEADQLKTWEFGLLVLLTIGFLLIVVFIAHWKTKNAKTR